jgi:hypothetical protein
MVLALVAGVAGVLSPALESSGRDAFQEESKTQLQAIAKAFREFRRDMGVWPSTGLTERGAPGVHCAYLTGYRCLFDDMDHVEEWRGPYLVHLSSGSKLTLEEGAALDPWGHSYQIYRFPAHTALGGERGVISAVSLGPNGTVDTSFAGIAKGQPAGDDLVKVVTVTSDNPAF